MGFNEVGIIFKIRRTPEMINGSDVSGGAWTGWQAPQLVLASSVGVFAKSRRIQTSQAPLESMICIGSRGWIEVPGIIQSAQTVRGKREKGEKGTVTFCSGALARDAKHNSLLPRGFPSHEIGPSAFSRGRTLQAWSMVTSLSLSWPHP